LCRAGIAISVLLTALILSSSASAQSVVTIRLINGRNGKPLAKIRVQIGFDDLKGRTTLDLTSNEQGEIQFAANESKTFQVHPFGIVSCGEKVIGAPYYHDYSITEILKTGALKQNNSVVLRSSRNVVGVVKELRLGRTVSVAADWMAFVCGEVQFLQ
jgi:hypothetical protein